MVTLRCPHCQAKGMKQLAARKAGPYSIIYCRQCGAIHGVVPDVETLPASRQSQPEPAEDSPDNTNAALVRRQPGEPSFLARLGHADLSAKEPYSPEKMAARVRAAGRGHGTSYLRVAVDLGPPLCSRCKVDMQPQTIPAGYPNAGRKVWVCPNFGRCQQWELAEQPNGR